MNRYDRVDRYGSVDGYHTDRVDRYKVNVYDRMDRYNTMNWYDRIYVYDRVDGYGKGG